MYQFVFPDGDYCTPLSCDFAHEAHYGNLVAIGDEEGRVSILRTDKNNSEQDTEFHHTFYGHKHGIADVKFSTDDSMLITASLDRLVRLWDTETRQSLIDLPGHADAVKSVNWHPFNEHLIITGAKDGSFRIWDTRFRQKAMAEEENAIPAYDPIKIVKDAHKLENKKPARKNKDHLVIRSVTCALFLSTDETKAITSGSVDGAIKLWDIRAGRDAQVIESTVFENQGGQRRGVTDMKIDKSGTRLFSSCMDNSIYMHYLTDLQKPAARYTDPDFMINTFDIKISISPNDEFIMAGSHDQDIFVWEMDTLSQRAYKFQGHTRKVTGVCWHKSTLKQFVSCSEDFTARVWQFERDPMCNNVHF